MARELDAAHVVRRHVGGEQRAEVEAVLRLRHRQVQQVTRARMCMSVCMCVCVCVREIHTAKCDGHEAL